MTARLFIVSSSDYWLFQIVLIDMYLDRPANIDGLREQIVLWAVQDLKIKREHRAPTVQVPDPLGWLNKTASKVCGYDLKLQVLEMFEEPQFLVCTSDDDSARVVFSPLSPRDLRLFKNGKQSRLSQFAGHHPLVLLPRNVSVHELSVLNGGHLFDLELSLAWKALTGRDLEIATRLWMYEYS